MTDRVTSALETLEFLLADEFVRSATKVLRSLSDQEINRLYLETHTDWLEGEMVDRGMAVILPLVDAEAELRRAIEMEPAIGPFVAPELYKKGGHHELPF